MIEHTGLFDIGFIRFRRLVNKSLQPQDLDEGGTSRYLLIKLEANDVEPVGGGDIAAKHVLDKPSRIVLITKKMKHEAAHPLPGQWISGIG